MDVSISDLCVRQVQQLQPDVVMREAHVNRDEPVQDGRTLKVPHRVVIHLVCLLEATGVAQRVGRACVSELVHGLGVQECDLGRDALYQRPTRREWGGRDINPRSVGVVGRITLYKSTSMPRILSCSCSVDALVALVSVVFRPPEVVPSRYDACSLLGSCTVAHKYVFVLYTTTSKRPENQLVFPTRTSTKSVTTNTHTAASKRPESRAVPSTTNLTTITHLRREPCRAEAGAALSACRQSTRTHTQVQGNIGPKRDLRQVGCQFSQQSCCTHSGGTLVRQMRALRCTALSADTPRPDTRRARNAHTWQGEGTVTCWWEGLLRLQEQLLKHRIEVAVFSKQKPG